MPDATHESANLHKHATRNPIYRWHLEQFFRAQFEMLHSAAPATVLDAGCGEGFGVADLKRRDPSLRLTGVDLSPEAVAYARQHFGQAGAFAQGSVYELPFEDQSFDLVLCSEVLEHLDEPERAVAELRRVARRHLLLTVPREPIFHLLNDFGRALGLSPDPGHVNFWTPDAFRTFVQAEAGPNATFRLVHVYQLALVAL